MENLRITSVLIRDRIKEAGKTQGILSKYGHIIRNRLGFHEVTEAKCSRIGIILLQHPPGNDTEYKNFIQELNQIGGIEVKTIEHQI